MGGRGQRCRDAIRKGGTELGNQEGRLLGRQRGRDVGKEPGGRELIRMKGRDIRRNYKTTIKQHLNFTV